VGLVWSGGVLWQELFLVQRPTIFASRGWGVLPVLFDLVMSGTRVKTPFPDIGRPPPATAT
jgi:hypothetical protein